MQETLMQLLTEIDSLKKTSKYQLIDDGINQAVDVIRKRLEEVQGKEEKKKDKLLISIVGPIAAGKSTFCKVLQELNPDKIGVFKEDIEGYLELVNLYYNDPLVYTAPFQLFMICRKMINIYSATVESEYPINVIERTCDENRDIFAKNRYDNGFSSDKAWKEYSTFLKMVNPVIPQPNFYIYLTGKPNFLLERIRNQRKRAGEEMITLEYMKSIDILYNQWIIQKQKENCYVYKININRNLIPEEMNEHFWRSIKKYQEKGCEV